MLVIIKTWDRMVAEYGLIGDMVNVDGYFSPAMEEALPPTRIIDIDMSNRDTRYYKWYYLENYWYISEDMIAAYLPQGIDNGKN